MIRAAHLIIHRDGGQFVSTMDRPSTYHRAEGYRVFEVSGEDVGYGFRIDETGPRTDPRGHPAMTHATDLPLPPKPKRMSQKRYYELYDSDPQRVVAYRPDGTVGFKATVCRVRSPLTEVKAL